MSFRRITMLVAGLLLVSPLASAETETECTEGNCVYRFDDGDVNSPGWSAYADYLRIRHDTPRVFLIRPRVSFVMELFKSTEGVW